MKIDRLFYPVTTLGFGRRVGIWTIGCPHHCNGCSNPELWDFSGGGELSAEQAADAICDITDRIDGITITGGDPFAQADELLKLVRVLESRGFEDILIYSGYTLEEIEVMSDDARECLNHIAALVDGRYVDELNDNLGMRGSSNQRLHLFKEQFAERYADFCTCRRSTRLVNNSGRLMAIGIQLKVEKE